MNNLQTFSTYVPQPDATEPTSSHGNRICETANRVTITDGLMTESASGKDSATVADLNPWQGTNSFAATARNANGTPVTELLPTTLVTIDGVQAAVSTWVAQGRLQKGADGTYSEAAGVPEAAPVETADYLPMDQQGMAQVNQALDTVDQGNLGGLMAMGIAVAVNGLDPRNLSHKFTSVSGLGGEDGAARLAAVRDAYQAQADHALLSRSGIPAADLPEFYAWARQHHRGELQQAVQRQMQQHDVSGYKSLADRWLNATPPSLNAMKAAGLPVRTHTMGSEVFLRGQWMTPSAAAKAGLI